jgi:putative MATE family efflux protein
MLNKNTMNLGTEKIGKLYAAMSIPAVLGMLVNALYNIIDTIVVGQGISSLVSPEAGTYALGGLAIVFPIQMLLMALAGMIGMGASSVVSRSLGRGDQERANHTTGNAYTLSILAGIFFTFFILIFKVPLLNLFGATKNNFVYAKEYIDYIQYGITLVFITITGANIIRAEGNSKMSTIIMVSGALTNIILDPIFVFVLEMGVKGVAIATVLSRVVSLFFILSYYLRKKSSIQILKRHFKLKLDIVKETVIMGLANLFRQITISILAIIVNNTLKYYGKDIAISVYGVINRIFSFPLMILFGLAQGFLPISGYNYGAKKMDRVKKSIGVSIGVSTAVAFVAFIVLTIFAETVLRIFSKVPALIEMGIPALKTIILALPFIGSVIIISSHAQAIGKAIPSLILALTRQVIFLIPLLLILPHFLGLEGLWMAFPIADSLSVITSLIWIKYEFDSHKNKPTKLATDEI